MEPILWFDKGLGVLTAQVVVGCAGPVGPGRLGNVGHVAVARRRALIGLRGGAGAPEQGERGPSGRLRRAVRCRLRAGQRLRLGLIGGLGHIVGPSGESCASSSASPASTRSAAVAAASEPACTSEVASGVGSGSGSSSGVSVETWEGSTAVLARPLRPSAATSSAPISVASCGAWPLVPSRRGGGSGSASSESRYS